MFPQLGKRCFRSGQISPSVTIIQSLPKNTCQDHLFKRQTISRQNEIISFTSRLDASLKNLPLPTSETNLTNKYASENIIQNFGETSELVEYLHKKFKKNISDTISTISVMYSQNKQRFLCLEILNCHFREARVKYCLEIIESNILENYSPGELSTFSVTYKNLKNINALKNNSRSAYIEFKTNILKFGHLF